MERQRSGKGIWTLKYAVLNIAYFAAFCTVHAYAAVFLLDRGFTNTQIGILLALANVISAVIQPVIAGIIDRQTGLTNKRFILISVITIMAGSLLLMINTLNPAAVFIIYVIIYMIQFAYQPVMTALCFEYRKAGCDIFYGLARGLGSAGFAVTAAFIGSAVEKNGVFILLIVNVAAMAVSAAVILLFKKPEKASEKKTGAEDALSSDHGTGKTGGDIRTFVRTYPAFSVFLIATICFFFGHNMINDFMIQIIRELGGGEKILGYANFLQAILELPVMAGIGLILKKVSSKNLLLFSGAAFFVKILILLFAVNMAGLFISQSFQLFAYAVFIPAAAYYVSETMEEYDQVKGQAFITSAITTGGVFSNLISGTILDNFGVHTMLICGSIVCFIGVITSFAAMTKLPHHIHRV
ncbi:MAG: MFS transporter [Lachnospiraceae bacterium]|nr:MFS transporter [Lachnospiraceae bacterium]